MKTSLILILGFQFLVRFGATLLFVASQTFFFRQAGVEHLPALYSVVNLTFIGLQLFCLPYFRQHAGKNLGRLLLGFVLLLGLAGKFLLQQDAWGVAGLLLSVMVFELLFGQFFTLYLAETFPLQEGKTVMPLVSAFAGISSIMAGISLKLLLTHRELSDLFLVGTLTMGLACLVWFIWYRDDDRKKIPEPGLEVKESPESQKTEGLDDSQKTLLLWVLILAGLNMVGKYWLDYQYSRGINQAFPTEKELASFIALFSSTTDFLVITSQLLLTGPLLRNLKLATALYFMPALVLLACLIHLPVAGLASLLAAQFLYTYLTKTFFQPSLSLVFSVFPPDSRSRIMERFGLVAATSALAAGLFLVAGGNHLPGRVSFVALIIVFSACLWAVHRLNSGYVAAVIGALGRSDRSWQPSDPEILARLDQSARKSWVQRMMQGEVRDRLRAIPLIPRLLPLEAAAVLLPFLNERESPRIKEAVARALIQLEESRQTEIDAFLLNEANDVRARATLLETVGCDRRGKRYLSTARRLLDSPSLRLQAAAVAVVGSHEQDAGILQPVLARLWNWAENSTNTLERGAGAVVMGVLGHEAFVPHLQRMALATDTGVSVQAVQALGRIPASDSRLALAQIESEASIGTVRELARKERSKLERLAETDTIKIFECLNQDERNRLMANRGWIHEPGTVNRMLQSLKIRGSATRRAWIMFWAEAVPRLPEGQILAEAADNLDSDPFEQLCGQLVTRPEWNPDQLMPLFRCLMETEAWEGFDLLLDRLLARFSLVDACRHHLSGGRFPEGGKMGPHGGGYQKRHRMMGELVNGRTRGRLPPDVRPSGKEGRFTASLVQEILLESCGAGLAKKISRVLLEPDHLSLHEECRQWSGANPADWLEEKCRAFVEQEGKD